MLNITDVMFVYRKSFSFTHDDSNNNNNVWRLGCEGFVRMATVNEIRSILSNIVLRVCIYVWKGEIAYIIRSKYCNSVEKYKNII